MQKKKKKKNNNKQTNKENPTYLVLTWNHNFFRQGKLLYYYNYDYH